MENLFIAEKEMMLHVIDVLKTLDVRGYDSYEKLVHCVILLTESMKNKVKNEQAKPKEEGEKVDG